MTLGMYLMTGLNIERAKFLVFLNKNIPYITTLF